MHESASQEKKWYMHHGDELAIVAEIRRRVDFLVGLKGGGAGFHFRWGVGGGGLNLSITFTEMVHLLLSHSYLLSRS